MAAKKVDTPPTDDPNMSETERNAYNADKFRQAQKRALDEFREQAQKRAAKIPSVTLILDVGQHVVGSVVRRGSYNHPEFGTSPVIVFNPEHQATNVPVGMIGAESVTVADLPPEYAYVIVGIGQVLAKLARLELGDQVYIERYDDERSQSTGFEYKNYGVMVSRAGAPPIPLDEIAGQQTLPVGTSPTEQAFMDQLRRFNQGNAQVSGEEPF
jgi:hypothetical protein